MKYIILIGDGMADHPIKKLKKMTPLEVARTPNMDQMANAGTLGLFKSVPKGFPPGSDVANLSILGYDPKKYYTGRSPLEAASIGVELGPDDIAFRCNLVTLDKNAAGKTYMKDYSAGHITTDEAFDLIDKLDDEMKSFGVSFHPGTAYRHLMVWPSGKEKLKLTPPHDISDKEIENYLPEGDGADFLIEVMEAANKILENHRLNRMRRYRRKNPANNIWLWGHGRAPEMPTLKERFGISGSMISAVDLLKGIGVYAGLKVLDVPGATGYIDTNYDAKAEYALRSLVENDFVCVHVEAPDEAGHQGNLEHKIQAIEDFDELIVGRILDGVRVLGPHRVLVLPDHYTPVELKTHTSEAVPFVLYRSGERGDVEDYRRYTEKNAKASKVVIEDADALAELFFSK